MNRPVPRVWLLAGALAFTLAIANGLHRDGLLGTPRAARATQQLAEHDRAVSEVRSRVLGDLEQGGEVRGETRDAAFQELDRQFAKAEAVSSKTEAGIWRVQRRWLAEVKAVSDDAFMNYAAFSSLPHIDNFQFESRQEVEAAAAMAAKCETSAASLLQLMKQTPDRLALLLREEGVDEGSTAIFLKGATKHLGLTIRARELEGGCWSGARVQLEVLRDQWGHWSHTVDGLEFQDPQVCEAFWARQDSIETQRVEALELMKTLMQLQP